MKKIPKPDFIMFSEFAIAKMTEPQKKMIDTLLKAIEDNTKYTIFLPRRAGYTHLKCALKEAEDVHLRE